MTVTVGTLSMTYGRNAIVVWDYGILLTFFFITDENRTVQKHRLSGNCHSLPFQLEFQLLETQVMTDVCLKKKKANKQNFRWINVYSYFFTWKLQLVFCHYDCLHLLNLRLSELFSLYNRWTQLLDSMCMQAK